MKHSSHTSQRPLRLLCLFLIACSCLTVSAFAANSQTLNSDVYHFTQEDFSKTVAADLNGIYISQVPSATVAQICYGDRVLCPGDVVPSSVLDQLTLLPVATTDQDAAIVYLPITSAGVGEARTLKVGIFSGKNKAPTAQDVSMETYKNIPNTSNFSATDPEGEEIAYQIISAPTRGSVEIGSDGTFTYTPAKNKVGKDSFTYVAVDPAGNTSNTATVSVEILKASDKTTFADMVGDSDQFVAMWMRENDLFAGEEVAGTTCFGPDKEITRGEFLVMVMKLANIAPDDAQLTSGFADESQTPQWMRPYLVSALRSGIISGVNSEEGLVFRPTAALTQAEAAVMLQNILDLPSSSSVGSFDTEETSDVPAWAENAMATLNTAGIPLSQEDAMETVSRREAANLLYASSRLLPEQAEEDDSVISWIKDKLSFLF